MLSARLSAISFSRAPALLLLVTIGLGLAWAPTMAAVLVIPAAIVLMLVFAKVEYGLYLLAFAVPFGFYRDVTIATSAVTPTDGLIGLLLLSWLFKVVATRQVRLARTPVLLALAIFLLSALPSAMAAESLSLFGKEMVKWLEFAVAYVVAVDLLATRPRVLTLLLVLFLAGSLEALYGWYQFLLHVGPPGFEVAGRFIRAFGTFGQPNPFAAYVALVLTVAAGVLLGLRRPREMRDYLLAGAAAATFLICLAALFMSMSRGAWLGFAAAALVMIVTAYRRALLLFVPIVLVIGLMTASGAWDVLPGAIVQRTTAAMSYFRIFDARTTVVNSDNYPIVERMAYWQSAWEMFSVNPFFGTGFGNFPEVYPEYALPNWQGATAPHAHNYYLNILAETGGVGFIGYVVFIVTLGGVAAGAIRRASHKRASPSEWHVGPITGFGLALGVGGLLIVLLVHNVFDNLYVHSMTAQVGLMLGLLPALDVIEKRREFAGVGETWKLN